MSKQLLAEALLAVGLALVPLLYLYGIWPTVPAFVPTHYSPPGMTPDHFVGRQWLWNIVWLQAIAFVIFTFLPQVQAGESTFWSSQRQRRVRLAMVGVLALYVTFSIHYGAQLGRGPNKTSVLSQRKH